MLSQHFTACCQGDANEEGREDRAGQQVASANDRASNPGNKREGVAEYAKMGQRGGKEKEKEEECRRDGEEI